MALQQILFRKRDLISLQIIIFVLNKGQIGEFAKNKIQRIIDAVKQKRDDDGRWRYPRLQQEEAEKLKEEISLISEELIRDKLYEMLYKCLYRDSGPTERKIRIYEEKLERLRRGEDS